MGVGGSTFYDTPDARARDLTIVAEMKTICDEFEAYGYRHAQPSGFGFEYCASHVRFRVFQQTASAVPTRLIPPRSVLDLPICHQLKIHSANQLDPVCVGGFHVGHSLLQSARV
jgi:hypothetical protein